MQHNFATEEAERCRNRYEEWEWAQELKGAWKLEFSSPLLSHPIMSSLTAGYEDGSKVIYISMYSINGFLVSQTAENEDIERMRQKLQNYQEKDRENQEAAEKQAALHANLTKEIAELKQQLETESQAVGNLRKDLDNLTQERDACKVKVQELEMHPEGSKVSIYLKK